MGDKEKIIWITGASSGIGRSIALRFIKEGKNVAASSRRKEHLEEIKQGINSKGQLFKIFPMNISNSQEVEDASKNISKDFEIDCLINNAGITSFKKAIDNTTEEIREIIGTNLLGSINTIKAVLPIMIENHCGTIINIISVVTKKIFTESSAYSASKSGLLAYTKVLREEVRQYNIRIIDIIPGATRTSIWPERALEKYSNRMMSPDDIGKFVYDLYMIDSNLVPEEIIIRPMKGDL